MEHEHRIAVVDMLTELNSVQDDVSIRYIAKYLTKLNPDVADAFKCYVGTYLEILDDEQLEKEIA